MLLQFEEQIIGHYMIPSFSVSKGEIVIIKLPNSPDFPFLEFELVKFLTGEIHNNKIEFSTQFKFVEHFKIRHFLNFVSPKTIAGYLKKQANKSNTIYKRIFENEWLTPKTRLDSMDSGKKKLLSLFSTLSWTNNIVLDLAGMDPMGAINTYNILKETAANGGSAILIDAHAEFENDCTTYITAKKQLY